VCRPPPRRPPPPRAKPEDAAPAAAVHEVERAALAEPVLGAEPRRELPAVAQLGAPDDGPRARDASGAASAKRSDVTAWLRSTCSVDIE
jgi:hypothetical protein